MSFLLEHLVALIGLGVAIAGHAVVISGLTVAIGLFSLFVLPVPFLRSVGYGGMLIPLVALVAAITLLPVTLSAWGPALDRHRLRPSSSTLSRGWERWGQIIVQRRWLAGAAG